MKHPNRKKNNPRRASSPSGTAKQPSTPKSYPKGSAWISHNFYVLLSSLGQIVSTPLPSFMTAAVIGIALALPTSLYLLLENVQQVSSEWSLASQISLFLKLDTEDIEVHKLADQLYERPDIVSVQVITPTEALEEYRNLSGFSDALKALKHNPLPAVLVIQPAASKTTESLLSSLAELPQVEVAQFDMLWLKRLFAMIKIVRRGVLILACLLALAVLLVIGNTIRLSIYNRREEIEVHKLVGATDGFIRRPFLYMGFWYGLFGGLIAWLLVNI
jgi:cell division transport system permease protein